MGTQAKISHDDKLREVVGEGTAKIVNRIVATYRQATPEQRADGANWYAEGEGIINSLAEQSGMSRKTVAAVISHLSPQTTWARNVWGATSLILTGKARGCLGANIDRALNAILASYLTGDALGTLNGPKTRRFALNLLGDRDAVTVDVWALRVALGKGADERVLGRVGVYDAIEHCYRLAAKRLGVDPTDVQATTWIVVRNGRKG